MAKVKDAYANPTPMFAPVKYSEYTEGIRKQFRELVSKRNQLANELADIEVEIEHTSKHLIDNVYLEQQEQKQVFSKKKEQDPDGEYQNLVDNQMMHDEL